MKRCGILLLALLLAACSTPATPPPASLPAPPQPTPSPFPSATFTATPVPVLPGCVSGSQPLRLRRGPQGDSGVIAGLLPGACFSAYGTSEDKAWLWVFWQGHTGWLAAQYVSLQGDAAILPLLTAQGVPITPTATDDTSVRVETLIPSPTPTSRFTATSTHTPIPTWTPTSSPTLTPTRTPTLIPTWTPTPTPTRTPTRTPTSTPTRTPTRTPTFTPTRTPVPSISPTEAVLLCSDALPYAGQTITCKLPRAYCAYQPQLSGTPTFCTDAPLPDYNFIFVVWGQNWSYLDGSCLLVSGEVTLFAGKPEIVVTSKTQLSSCP